MRIWHVLDVGSIWLKEFASALSKTEEVIAWAPQIETLGVLRGGSHENVLSDPPLRIQSFPLQRGYARAPLRWIISYERRLLRSMLEVTTRPHEAALICTTPFYVPLAERWPGPVIYYLTDKAVAYPSLNPGQVTRLDRRMCHIAQAVCPNSKRIAEYLIDAAQCPPAKITIVPNATREDNVLDSPRDRPGPCPGDISDLPRPIAGVLGDLSGNLDWKLVASAIKQTDGFSWLFVGPAEKKIDDPEQHVAREWVKQRARFVGFKPYGELQQYARCLNVALLPYKKKEPTFSGSSTRFYEHLAAGRPMLATRGFAELLDKEPLLTLVDTGADIVKELARLAETNFSDGQETSRWNASKLGTWEQRTSTIRKLLDPVNQPNVDN